MLDFAAIKRLAIVLLFLSLAAALRAAEAKRPAASSFTVVEATIPEMRAAMEQGRVTSRELVLQSLARIAIYEDKLHAAITVNRDALKEADERDRERRLKKVRGPLHGIPVAVKDNIHTTDMPTTGGALVFEGFVPPYEATLIKNLRDAGAIRGRRPATGGPPSRPAGRAPGSAPRPVFGPGTSAPRRRARSSRPRTRTCSPRSSRRSAASAATASSRSRRTRTLRARWPGR